MTDADAMLARLEVSPEDWDGWRVLADYYEIDAGNRQLAHACRWMAGRHKRPFRSSAKKGVWVWVSGRMPGWSLYRLIDREEFLAVEEDIRCRLGRDLLPEGPATHPTLHAAVRWLADRLEGLRRTWEVGP